MNVQVHFSEKCCHRPAPHIQQVRANWNQVSSYTCTSQIFMNLYPSSDPWFLLLFSLFCHIDLYFKAAIANDMSNVGHCFPNINSLVTYIFYILKGFTSNFNAFREIKQSVLLLNLKCSGPLKHLHPMTKFSTFNSFEDYSDDKSIIFC